MIGWMPASEQAVANSRAPNRLPLSVIATAGIASPRHSPTSSLILIAPADSEYGLWTRRWMKSASGISVFDPPAGHQDGTRVRGKHRPPSIAERRPLLSDGARVW